MSIPMIIQAKREIVKKVEQYCEGHPTDVNGFPMSLQEACRAVGVQYDVFMAHRKYLASLPRAYQDEFKKERVENAKRQLQKMRSEENVEKKRKVRQEIKNMEAKETQVIDEPIKEQTNTIEKSGNCTELIRVFIIEGPAKELKELIKEVFTKNV